jgi:N-acetylglucosaminyl-diphospho-decaprenol L-rhamnosyltransferase
MRLVNTGPSSSGLPRIGLVTVSYGSGDVVGMLLETASRATDEPLEMVVVDNRAPDVEIEELARAHGARYVARPDNPGYGGAINAGVATLGSQVEWVLVVNPDVSLGAGAIDALRERGETADDIATVGPVIRQTDGTIYPSARAVPSIRNGIGHALFVSIWPDNPWTAHYRVDPTTLKVSDVGWLSGSCLLVRRSAFEKIGGFDDEYFMYFEDVDLGFRFGKAGFRNVYEPTSEVVHIGATTTSHHRGAMVRAHHESARRFISRKYPGAVLWPVRVVLRTGLSIRSAILARHADRS